MQTYTWNTTCSKLPNSNDELILGLACLMPVKCHHSLPEHIKNDTSDLQSTVYGANISPSILQTNSCFICRFATPNPVENKNKTHLFPSQQQMYT
jgi:hypothetical protein